MLMDRSLYANGPVPVHLGPWPAILAGLLHGDPEATAMAAHIVAQARRSNYAALENGTSIQVLVPVSHAEGWNVAARRTIIPNSTPIPRARYLNMSHYTADEHYVSAPAWRADAPDGPLDNSLASWAEAMPSHRASGPHRGRGGRAFRGGRHGGRRGLRVWYGH